MEQFVMEPYMWIVWLSLFVLMVIVEALGPSLISIWFAFGALVALIISFIPGVAWWVQVIVFVAVSAATLIALRPLCRRYFKRNVIRSNVDSIVGKRGKLTDDISPFSAGTCRINDVSWTAVSPDENETIAKESVVEVIAISGNKLIVKKVEEKK